MNSSRQLVVMCRNFEIDFNQFSNPIYVGVESGCISLLKNNLPIEFIIGDFDSVTQTEIAYINQKIKEKNINFFPFDQEKDLIDAELAIIKAIELNLYFDQIILVTSGKRWDMILAQINLINKYFNYQPILINENNYVLSLKEQEVFNFTNMHLTYKYVSIFSLEKNKVIYNLRGCKYYDNQDITINNKDVLAVSNEFTKSNDAKLIEIKKGKCLVFLFKTK